jgi:hypothetical protein
MVATLVSVSLWATGDPSMAQRPDPFGPRPQFDWIKAGDPRPTPRIAETAIGIEPMAFLGVVGTPGSPGSGTSWGPSPSDCYRAAQPVACLRRNWLAVLGVLGERELSAPASGRSYRLLLFPSFTPWISVRLDIQTDGSAKMAVSRALEDTTKGAKPLGRSSMNIDPKDVAAVETDLKVDGFERLSPESERSATICTDGTSVVLEALVDGRYRYVARHSCQSDFDHLWGMTARIRATADLVEPPHLRPPAQPSQN